MLIPQLHLKSPQRVKILLRRISTKTPNPTVEIIDCLFGHSNDIKVIAESLVTPICATLEKNQEKERSMHEENQKTEREFSAERRQKSSDRVTVASQHNVHATKRLLWVLAVISVMIIGCSFLVFYAKLSPETFALLIGTVIGYLIAFLSKNEQIIIAPREKAQIGDEEY